MMKRYSKNQPFQGIITVNHQGYGFVKGDAGYEVFIPPKMMGGAISGDTVEVAIDATSDPERPSGAVRRILARKFSEFAGCLVPVKGGWAIRPLRRELPQILPLSPESLKKSKQRLAEGNWAKAALPIQDDPRGGCGYAELLENIGASGQVTADLNAIVAEYGIPAPYTAREEEAAAALKPLKVRRTDCTDKCCVTIDPQDARDYDDALSCEPGALPGEWIVGVHIADVACYVSKGSWLDKAARSRGFTSYLPGRTLPMLPKALANRQCSLQAGEERLAHSVFIHINIRTGEIIGSERRHTLIKVRQRLCYEQVQAFLDGTPFEAEAEVLELVRRLNELAQQLRRHRAKKERFLPMAMPEIRVVCSETPSRIVGIQENVENPSHQLVEEFMLAANQCVAEELLRRGIPGVFRNHLAPEMEKLNEFAQNASLMLGKKVGSLNNRSGIVRFLKAAEKSPLRDVLCMLFLRQLPRADYGVESFGHFGLGKERYCHFTSPIRRYADTLVHQQLFAVDCRRKTYGVETIGALAAECSSLEFNCDQASFAASDRMKIRYVEELCDENPEFTLRGEVCSTSRTGAGIFLPKFGLMAFVNASDLDRGWRFDQRKKIWTDSWHQDRLFVTQERRFRILSSDPIRGELVLLPAPAETKTSSSASRKKKSKQTHKKR